MKVRRGRGLVVALVVAVCTSTMWAGTALADGKSDSKNASTKQPTGTGEREVSPLFFLQTEEGAEGGSNPVTVTVSKSKKKEFRVAFSETDVAGTGDQWRASGWTAAAVATMLAGAPLQSRKVEFELNGPIDGPSAGALLTVSIISILRGDKLKKDITMTGTINPDGTVGPVGGINYKLDGAKDAKKKRVLIPVGQRNAPDLVTGELVDNVEVGRRLGLKVKEVSTIYEAYKEFTGKSLPKPESDEDPELDNKTYTKFQDATEEWLGKFQKTVDQYSQIDPAVFAQIADTVSFYETEADFYAGRADQLLTDGQQAGAFISAVNAVAFARSALTTAEAFQAYITNPGYEAYFARIQESADIGSEIEAFVDDLKNYEPETLSDAGALIDSYSVAIVALALQAYAEDLAVGAENAVDDAEMLGILNEYARIYEIAGTLVQASSEVFNIGRDLKGPKISSKTNVKAVASFFSKAADANTAAFESLIVKQYSEELVVDMATASSVLAGADADWAIALYGRNLMPDLDEYFADAETFNYARLGGALGLFSRSAGLLAKYYSLGVIDTSTGTVELVDLKSEKAVNDALEFGESQVASSIGLLKSEGVDPALVVASYEDARATANQTGAIPSDKLNALSNYWSAFVATRMLAYLGNFPTAGLSK